MLKAETETTIRWDAEDRTAYIWTNDPSTIRKMDKLVEEDPDNYCRLSVRAYREGEKHCTYSVPVKLITFRKQRQYTMSEEQKRAAADRLRNFREQNNSES